MNSKKSEEKASARKVSAASAFKFVFIGMDQTIPLGSFDGFPLARGDGEDDVINPRNEQEQRAEPAN